MSMAMIKVLIIDNDAEARMLMHKRMTRAASTVEIIESATVLTSLSQIKAYDDIGLIVLSLSRLPDSLCPEDTFDRILASSRGTPVVVISEYKDPELAMWAMRAGAADYRLKGDVNDDVVARMLLEATKRQNISTGDQRPATISDPPRKSLAISKPSESGQMRAVTNTKAHIDAMIPVLERLDRVVIRDADSVIVRLAKIETTDQVRKESKAATIRPPAMPQSPKLAAVVIAGLLAIIGTILTAILK